MTKNLKARLAKLEEASGSGELPNGGMLIAVMRDGETEKQALERAITQPEVARLARSQERRLMRVLLSEADALA